MLLGTPGQPLTLTLAAGDGNTGLYGRIRVYNGTGALQATVDLTHRAEGVYTSTWTPSTEGNFFGVGQFYTDAGRTAAATAYGTAAEDYDISAIRTNVARILGLQHENSYVDQTVYSVDGDLTAARIRTYDSQANAATHGATGLLYQYTVTQTYSAPGVMSTYGIARVL